MLISLTLTNFQKHRSFHHDFQAGLTLVTGSNWCGKSSLMRGILYSLYGSTAVPVRSHNLVSRGEKTLEATLVFRVHGLNNQQDYTVTRGLNKAELRLNGEVVASGQTPVTAMIQSLIGEAKSFLMYQTSRQGEADGMLTLGSTKLAQHINAVTGVEVVDQVLERIKLRRASYTGLQDLASRQDLELFHLEAQCEQQGLFLEDKQQQHTTLIAQQQQLHVEQAAADQLFQQLRSGWQAYLHYQQRQAEYQHHYQAAQERLQAAERLLQDNPDVDLNAAYRDFTRLLAASQAHQHAAGLIEPLRAALREADAVIAQLQTQQSEVKEPDGLSQRLATTRKSLSQDESALAIALGGLQAGICPTCQRPLGDDSEIHDLQQQAAQLQARIAEQQNHIYALELLWDTFERASQAADTVRTALSQWQSYREQQQHALEQATVILGQHPHIDAQELEQAKQHYDQLAMSQQARRSALLEQQQATLMLSKLGTVPDPVPEVPESQVRQAEQALNVIRESARTLEREDAVLKAEIGLHAKALTNDQQQLQTLQQRHAETQAQLRHDGLLAELAKYLRDNRDRFTQQAWAALLAYANQFIQDASGGDMTELRRTAEGDFTFVENGDELPLELASGMQLAILGVAIKLALAAAVGSRFEVLLFDEISAAASDENALRLTECLARSGQQVVLISHRSADAAVAQDVIAL